MLNRLKDRYFICLFRYIVLAVALSSLLLTGCLPKRVPTQPEIANICNDERELAKKAAVENIEYVVVFDTKHTIKNNQPYKEFEQKLRIFNMEELHKLLDNFSALIDYIDCLHNAYEVKGEEEEYDFDKVNRNADILKLE